jgi:tetratricopeptide (TPR) repeat protein
MILKTPGLVYPGRSCLNLCISSMVKENIKSTKSKIGSSKPKDWSLLYLASIPVLALVVFSPCLNYGVTNWDDNHYIRELLLIRSLSWDNIVLMFKTKVLLSYNPLVILSLALDYKLGGNSENWYHMTNVILHAINGMLVFIVMKRLMKNAVSAFFIALLFSLHPMHVESVAWIASRKDVLYSFFFLLSWWTYLVYSADEVKSFRHHFIYITSVVLFTLSGFSKIQAVALPLVLLLSDYLRNGTIRSKDLKDKIPYIAGALAFGWYAIGSSSLVADQFATPVSFGQKIAYSFQALAYYVYKLVLPIHQTAIYAFPLQGTGEYYMSLIAGVLLAAAVALLCVRNYRRSPVLVTGLLIFSFTIFPTLHVIALNSSLIYERFTYLSYIGLFMVLLSLPQWIPGVKKYWSIVMVLFILPMTVLAYQRCEVWKSSLSLWSDVISKNPRSHEAFNNRGAYYNEHGELDKALDDFNTSLQLNPRQPRTLNNRSMLWFQKKDYVSALKDADAAVTLDPRLAEAWCNRGNVYYNLSQYDTAIIYYSKAIELLPYFPSTYTNRGSAYLKKGEYQQSLLDYQKAIEQSPDYAEAWRLCALSYAEIGNDEKALQAMNQALSINPSCNAAVILSDEYNFMGQRSFNREPGSPDKAISYYQKAVTIYPSNASAFLNLGGMWYVKRDIGKARENWKKALAAQPGFDEALLWLNRTGGVN